MPRVTEIKFPPTRDQYGPLEPVGSKSIQWLARLKQAFRSC